MKSRLSHWLLATLLFSVVACTKEESKEAGKPQNTTNFSANIGTTLWNADSVQFIQVSESGALISGLSKTNQQISILLPSFQLETYAVNAQPTATSFALYADSANGVTNIYRSTLGNASGTVTITKIDTVTHTVSGIFSFTLVNESDQTGVSISNGVFTSIPYVGSGGSVTPPPTTPLDTLKATVDGKPFLANDIEYQLVNPGNLLSLSGNSADGTSNIGLFMPPDITPGNYSLDFDSGTYFGTYVSIADTNVLASKANGTLTIISNTGGRIKGTFSFTASPLQNGGTPEQITDGQFAITYQ